MKHYNAILHFPNGTQEAGATLISSEGQSVTYPFGKLIKASVSDDGDGIINIKDLDTGVEFYNICKDDVAISIREASHA